jgi:hypothetical protein
MVIKKRKFLGLSKNFIDEWWGVEIGNKELKAIARAVRLWLQLTILELTSRPSAPIQLLDHARGIAVVRKLRL